MQLIPGKIIRLALLFLIATAPLSASEPAQDRQNAESLFDASIEELLQIVVSTASRVEQKLSESPSAISVITSEQIRHSPARTIPELLQYVVGMDAYTKTHTDMDVAARGFAQDETNKTLVLIDGNPVNVVAYGGMQWPTLPITLQDIERIELLRGPGSSVWGADALTGVIHIITKRVEDREKVLSLQYGDRGTGHYDLHYAQAINDRWGFAVTGSFIKTENKGDAETEEAKLAAPNYGVKDWAEISSISYRLDYDGNSTSFSSSGGFSTDTEGYNASPGDASIDKAKKDTIYLSNQLKYEIDRDILTLKLGYRSLEQENETWGGSGYSFKYKRRKGDGIDSDIQYTVNRYENHTLIGGVNFNFLSSAMDLVSDSPSPYDYSDTLWAVYGQDQVRLFDDRLLFTLGARYDKWSNLDGMLTPRAAANIFFMDKKLTLRFAVGKSFRRTSFDGRYYFASWSTGWLKGSEVSAIAADGSVVPGKKLLPEKMLAYETGLRYQPNRDHMFSIEYFRNIVTDSSAVIPYYSNPATGELNLTEANVAGEIVIYGLEFESQNRIMPNLSTFANYTYQWAEVEDGAGNKSRWNNAPTNKLSAGFFYQNMVDLDIRFRYVSKVAYSEIPSNEVDDYTTVDLALSKRINDSFFAKLSVINLLDNQHYEYPIYTQITRKVMFNLQYRY